MKTALLSLALVCLLASTTAFAEDPALTESQKHLLQNLHDAEKKLGEEAPNSAADLYIEIYRVVLAGDEALKAGFPANAKALYLGAWGCLVSLCNVRPDWQPKIVDYKLRLVESRVKSAVVVGGGPITPPPTTRPLKEEKTAEVPPNNWLKFQFNGVDYYSIPL